MATIDDIARKAGVSAATVSYILNNKKQVSPETKERVLQAIKELDYKPNKIARSLATQSSQIIGVLISDIANPFFSSIVRGIQDVSELYGYTAIIGNSDENEQRAEHYMGVLAQHRVDGMIISPMKQNSRIFDSCSKDIPLVFINRRCNRVEADIVETNNERGALEAVNHLVKNGHERIALISGPTNVSTYGDRLRGYKNGLKQNGIPFRDEYVRFGGYSYESGYTIAQDIMKMSEKPTALIVASGWLGIGVFKGLKEMKVKIPEDVSVISFDETEWSSLVTPSLTTIAQRTFEMGQIAAKVLLKQLNVISDDPVFGQEDIVKKIFDGKRRHIKLVPKLIIRDSVSRLK